jgi:hypothetical protein
MSLSFTRAQLARIAKGAGPNAPIHDLLKATKKPRNRRPKVGELPPSQGRTLKVSLPMPDNEANAGGKSRNFMTKYRARRAYFDVLDERAKAGLIPPPPEGGFGRVILTSVMYLGGKMDVDNAISRHKAPIDWLQRNGYLVNDQYAEWSGFPVQIIKQGQDYRIELELREP